MLFFHSVLCQGSICCNKPLLELLDADGQAQYGLGHGNRRAVVKLVAFHLHNSSFDSCAGSDSSLLTAKSATSRRVSAVLQPSVKLDEGCSDYYTLYCQCVKPCGVAPNGSKKETVCLLLPLCHISLTLSRFHCCTISPPRMLQ